MATAFFRTSNAQLCRIRWVHVMRGMGLVLAKNDKAKKELDEKGMAE
jgi:hypothetical protein